MNRVIKIILLGIICFVTVPFINTDILAQDKKEIDTATKVKADNLFDQASVKFEQGIETGNTSKISIAINYIEKALSLYQLEDSSNNIIYCLNFLGKSYRALGNNKKAIDYYKKSLNMHQEIGENDGIYFAINNILSIYNSIGDHVNAIKYNQQFLEIANSKGDRQKIIEKLNDLGDIHYLLREYNKAIHYYEISLGMRKEVDNPDGLANLLFGLGNSYYFIGKPYKSIDYYKLSLDIYIKNLDRQIVAKILGNIAVAYQSINEKEKAINYFIKTIEVSRDIGGREDLSNALENLGIIYLSQGEYKKAIGCFQEILSQEFGDPIKIANNLSNLGLIYTSLRKYSTAISYHQDSLDIAHKTGRREVIAKSLNNFGETYLYLGRYDKAIEYFSKSAKIKRELNDKEGLANSLGNLGNVYLKLGKHKESIYYHSKSLKLDKSINEDYGIARSLNNLGAIYYYSNKNEKSIKIFQKSLSIKKKIGDHQGVAHSLGNLGSVYLSLGNIPESIKYFEQSLTIGRDIGDHHISASALHNLGAAYYDDKKYPQAELSLRKSLQIWENIRRKLNTDNQISSIDTQAQSYHLMQRVLIAQDKSEQALEIAERGRTRALIQQLHAHSPNAAQPVPTHPSIDEIKQIAIEQQATLVEYTLINNDLLYIWVVKPDGSIHNQAVNPKDIGPGIDELEQQNRAWLEQAQVTDGQSTDLTMLRQLHAVLIEPIAQHLPQNKPEERVIIIPHSTLFKVSFASLLNQQDEYLIENHTLITAPSIHSLSYSKPKSQGTPTSFLIAGNPTAPDKAPLNYFEPLSGAEGEATVIAKMFETEPLLGAQATETAIKSQFFTADIIHLAAHGKFDPEKTLEELEQSESETKTPTQSEKDIKQPPQGGYIALASTDKDDGYLTTQEITKMTVGKNRSPKAELVVLSACETGLGKVTEDGIIGLSRSLMVAGIPSLLVSQWSVPDLSTRELMQEFYTNVYKENMDIAKGLREAMLTAKKENPDPSHWAGFILIGRPE